jgi:very-short-patch-repair endonuclease
MMEKTEAGSVSDAERTSPPKSPSPVPGEGDLKARDDQRRVWEDVPQRAIKKSASKELWEMLKPLAREKRIQPTPSEDRLWAGLRNRQLNGLKFRRQHAIERFIVDFYCSDLGLVVEVDGEIHDYIQEEDALRQEALEALGFTVMRFKNAQVNNDLNSVLETISSSAERILVLRNTPSVTPSPGTGEGAGG